MVVVEVCAKKVLVICCRVWAGSPLVAMRHGVRNVAETAVYSLFHNIF